MFQGISHFLSKTQTRLHSTTASSSRSSEESDSCASVLQTRADATPAGGLDTAAWPPQAVRPPRSQVSQTARLRASDGTRPSGCRAAGLGMPTTRKGHVCPRVASVHGHLCSPAGPLAGTFLPSNHFAQQVSPVSPQGGQHNSSGSRGSPVTASPPTLPWSASFRPCGGIWGSDKWLQHQAGRKGFLRRGVTSTASSTARSRPG